VLIVAAHWLPGGPYDAAVRLLLGSIWLMACVTILGRMRVERRADLAAACILLLLATIMLMTSTVYGHYLVPAVALAALTNDRRIQRLVLWLSVGGLAAYGVELIGLALGPAWLGSESYRAVGTLVLLLPASVAALVDVRTSGRRPRESSAA
jgi:hypothetical protein